ncbi:hypothetical protein MCOR02_006833 [Pyricularia oryzae]|uniref:Cyclin-dependent kinase n=1 Tax=Pyricularia oryzae TaxID=318829 RepID=A0A4P7NRS1_PYROR|nr:hypothetical protein MCOR02_006833 [Pyricularia oryzae]KAI6300920.1 hypothetical protein MCOR34_009049 [Pyricularia oryzae]KAI6426343.1 hypothetical protein MCOR21_006750 [Pyricularia oryzae]KAI6574714.1 hypothetical protein MCOR09_002086 [Pyricularia oryzae]KAI6579795.1 hypothetical protein MCOR04_005929 [Pyricularia oryzae]
MNGAYRPADRGQSDAPVPAPAAASDTARKSIFSLPSLRGGSDADTHSSYSQQSQQYQQNRPQSSVFDWNEPERGRSTQPVARNPHHTQHSPAHSSQHRQSYATQQQQEQSNSTSFGAHQNLPNTNAAAASTKAEPEPNGNAFTPPTSASDGGTSGGTNGDGRHSQDSSQDSQLLQLSQLAAAREKLPADGEIILSPVSAGLKRKRMGPDAVATSGRESSSTSPVFGAPRIGHSRNTSTVSMASTTGSRMGELSHELKARLSYAMVKVNNGWESHSIDEVESLASRAASPNSTASTLPGRQGSSASPRLYGADNRSPTRPAGRLTASNHDRRNSYHPGTHVTGQNTAANSAMSPPLLKPAPSLAPPVSIKPSLSSINPRRNSNPTFSPAFLSHGYVSASPRTPVETASTHGTPRQATARTPMVDPIIFSPHQNVREQDAIESLLFMSSPGNSANLKHSFPSSSSQPILSSRTGGVAPNQRTALPSGQPRRTLPSSRPSNSQPTKRVGFEHSSSTLSDMDIDGPSNTSRGMPRGARVNGNANGNEHVEFQRPRIPLTLPAGLGTTIKPRRPTLTEADIDKMLDQCVAEDDSDSDEDEIQIPVRPPGVGIVKS